jgi:hypothetical protein
VQAASLQATDASSIPAAAASKRAKTSPIKKKPPASKSSPAKKTPPASKSSPAKKTPPASKKTSPAKTSAPQVTRGPAKITRVDLQEESESEDELDDALREHKVKKCKVQLKKLIKMKNFPKELQPRAGEFTRAELNEAIKHADELFPLKAREIAKECLGITGQDQYCGRLTVDYFSTMKKWYVGVVISVGPDPNDDDHPVYSVLFQDTEMINYTCDDDFRQLLDED